MTIKVIGIGLEGKKSLTTSLLLMVESADVLVGGDRHLNYFLEHQGIKLKINQIKPTIEQIKEYQKQGKSIVILATGDPLFFGIGRILKQEFSAEELEFYPYLSSVQIAFNRLQIPWQLAEVVSLHGREIDPLIKLLKQSPEAIAILTDKINNPLAIWQLFQQLKLPVEYNFWLCENLGSQSEKITKIEVEKELKLAEISSLNLIVLQQSQEQNKSPINLDQLPLIGINDNLFKTFPDRPGLITKREIRVQILGELALQNQQIIWDLGAGTGSVAIEMARICPENQIYAVEKTAVGVQLIKENCQLFQVKNIQIIHNRAEKAIANLPAPDRVFIGGSGGELVRLLELINQKIKPQGKIVIALATIENLATALAWFKEQQWQYQIINLQIAKSLSISNMTRLNPLNPVNLITAQPD